MSRYPSYLRVVVTARCSLACSYCHQEGDPAGAASGGLSTARLLTLLNVALDQGVRKLKFLGGEPLLRADLPEVISALRQRDPGLDISLITGGAVPERKLRDCFEAGLSRANLSIHGWSPAAFAERTQRGEAAWRLRQRCLELLLEQGRFLKLNFVWRGPQDNADLAGLLDHCAKRPVVVSVLDDLNNPRLGPQDVLSALTTLRGPSSARQVEDDPHSLPTLRLAWRDGLRVEVKSEQLGQVAPWSSCLGCPARARCREGIFALRLSHDGWLRPCMDRPDLGVNLLQILDAGEGLGQAWAGAVRTWVQGPSQAQEVCG